MPFPKRRLTPLVLPTLFILALLALARSPLAHAVDEEKPLHTSSDKQVWDRRTNKVRLSGHAVVRQPGETLMADVIDMDLNTRVLDAYGNCVYVTLDSVIKGAEMHFNLDTRTGTIVDGRVSNEKFTLAGERINKLGSSRFQTHWGEYSTCRDCTESWSLLAEDVDMEIEGYAYMTNVTTKIKDAPTFWLPYLAVPLKTQRQSGILFPHFSLSGINGFMGVLPYFWAINRSSDMTLGLGTYTNKGTRVEWEGRYALSPRSGGKANFYYIHDSNFYLGPNNTFSSFNRWGVSALQTQELPWHIEEKLKLAEVSDNRYPYDFPLDIDGGGNLDLSEELSFSWAGPGVSAYVAGRRFRNLLNGEPDPINWRKDFDPYTVQVLPTVDLTTNDQFLFGTSFAGGMNVGFTNFARAAGTFDVDPATHPSFQFGQFNPPVTYIAGQDPIRKAERFSITPDLYTTFRPFDVLSVIPSVKYFGYYYSFPKDPLTVTAKGQPSQLANLYRQYALFQVDISAQFEKIFDMSDPDSPKMKHLIRPILTYSVIPYDQEDNQHSFIKQINYARAQGIAGYNFDDYDIVPIDRSINDTNNYFDPLGDSLAVGFTTQLIRRVGKVDDANASYIRNLEFSAGDSIDFREFSNPVDPKSGSHPLSRFFSTLGTNFGKFTSGTTYYYYPYLPGFRNELLTSVSYIFERAVHQRLLSYDRSFTLGYAYNKVGGGGDTTYGTNETTGTLNFSLSDYIMPQFTFDYNWILHKPQGGTLAILFQSPAQCWRFTPNVGYSTTTGTTFSVDFALNIAGSGFGGVSDMANQAMSH